MRGTGPGETGSPEGGAGLAFRGAARPTDNAAEKKPTGTARAKYPSPITLRLTEEERARVEADANGSTLSAHIRACVLGRRAEKRVVPAKDRALLAQILAQLGATRIANNLNQLAYQANCGTLGLDAATAEEIKEACAHIAWLRVTLIEALGLKSGRRS